MKRFLNSYAAKVFVLVGSIGGCLFLSTFSYIRSAEAAQACAVASITSEGAVTSAALSGQKAFEATVQGAKWILGPATNQDIICATSASCRVGIKTQFAEIDMLNGNIGDSQSNNPIKMNDVDGVYFVPGNDSTILRTCGASLTSTIVGPGTLKLYAPGGGLYTRVCLCRFDGTTYKWFNVFDPSDTSGNTTTCPAE